MLVCRRFERLIGQTHEFYKNRKLVVSRSSKLLGKRFREESNKIQTRSNKRKCLAPDKFLPFGRFFGDVKLTYFYLRPANENLEPLMENLDVIGSKVIKLTVYNSKCDKNLLFDVLRLANCMQELIISYVWFNYQTANKNSRDQIDFPLLKTLKLDNITNLPL
jgi:hypothetical protein